MLKKFKKFVRRALEYLSTDIWRIPLENVAAPKSFFLRITRVIILAFRGFSEDKIQLRASALTFFTLLSIIPIIALAFWIAQGFGFEKGLESFIRDNLAVQSNIEDWLIHVATRILTNAQEEFLAGIGVVVLLFAVIRALDNIEGAFNQVWQIKRSRGFSRKVADYTSLVFLAPILIIISSSVSVYISTQVKNLSGDVSWAEYIGPILSFILRLLPYLIIWLLLTLLYLIMPNTRVKLSSAIAAGIIAGSLFQFLQWSYIHLQVIVSQNNPLWGGFVAFPLFLLWIQFSWIIVLFGAEISFASQNVHKYEFEADMKNLNRAFRKKVALMVTHMVIKCFEEGKAPVKPSEISNHMEIPIRYIRDVMFELSDCGIFVEIEDSNREEVAFLPSRDIHQMDILFVLQRMEETGREMPLQPKELAQKIEEKFDGFFKTLKNQHGNNLLKDL